MALDHTPTSPEKVTDDRSEAPAKTAGISRRALLRGASAAVPTIMTLQSGAALAQSSNLIGFGQAGVDADGKYHCLDATGIPMTDGKADIGSGPAHIQRISEREWTTGTGVAIDEVDMCNQGGTFFYQDGPIEGNQVTAGVVTSSGAYASFLATNQIHFTDL